MSLNQTFAELFNNDTAIIEHDRYQDQTAIVNHTGINDTMIVCDKQQRGKRLPRYYVRIMRLNDGIIERKGMIISVDSSKPTGVIDYLEKIKILPYWAIYQVTEL